MGPNLSTVAAAIVADIGPCEVLAAFPIVDEHEPTAYVAAVMLADGRAVTVRRTANLLGVDRAPVVVRADAATAGDAVRRALRWAGWDDVAGQVSSAMADAVAALVECSGDAVAELAGERGAHPAPVDDGGCECEGCGVALDDDGRVPGEWTVGLCEGCAGAADEHGDPPHSDRMPPGPAGDAVHADARDPGIGDRVVVMLEDREVTGTVVAVMPDLPVPFRVEIDDDCAPRARTYLLHRHEIRSAGDDEADDVAAHVCRACAEALRTGSTVAHPDVRGDSAEADGWWCTAEAIGLGWPMREVGAWFHRAEGCDVCAEVHGRRDPAEVVGVVEDDDELSEVLAEVDG